MKMDVSNLGENVGWVEVGLVAGVLLRGAETKVERSCVPICLC